MIRKNVFFLLLLFVLGSCSIEKRLYTDGYSIQWKKTKMVEKSNVMYGVKAEKKSEKQDLSVADVSIQNKKVEVASEEIACSKSELKNASTEGSAIKGFLHKKSQDLVETTNTKTSKPSIYKRFEQKIAKLQSAPQSSGGGFHWSAIASLACAVSAYLMGLMALTYSAPLIVMAIALSILAIVFGAIGMGKSSKRSAKNMARTGMILGIVGVVLLAITALVILILYQDANFYYGD